MSAPTTIGRYQLRERLGRGTGSVVYRAVDRVLDRQAALKVMAAEVARDSAARDRFLLEGQAVARLRHRHIVAVHEVAVEGENPYLAMELLRGTTLAERVAGSPPPTLVESLEIIDQVCLGLHYAHQRGVVHRNIKPANIFLLDDGSVKLLDFSLTSGAADTVTRAGTQLGSVAYMAPEQVVSHEVDGRADIFAAGVVLFELLGGRRPFDADSVTGVLTKILKEPPPPLENLPHVAAEPVRGILARALDKDPARRFADALDMADSLSLVRLNLLVPETPRTVDQPPVGISGSDALEYSPEPLAARDRLDPLARLPGRLIDGLAPLVRRPIWLVTALIVLLLVAGLGFWIARRGVPRLGAPAGTPIHRTSQPPTAAVASVDIVSQPEGAALFLNGAPLDLQTPARVPSDRLRNAEIRAEKEGFEPAVVRPSAADVDQRRIDLRLTPLPPEIVVTGSAAFPFEVLSGRIVVSPSATSHRFTVRGEQTLRLRAPQVFLDRAVTVTPGSDPVVLRVPEIGHLSVRTSPSLERCRISVGGRDFGSPPYPPIGRQPIVAGTHRVQLTCSDGSTLRESVTVEATRDKSVLFR
jgi:predicted Ser/Thr protein kinase